MTEDSVTLEWDCPDSDGNSPIKRYIIEKRQNNDSSFQLVEKVNATRFSAKVNGLKQHQTYFFRVFAENAIGKSEQAAEVAEGVETKSGKS